MAFVTSARSIPVQRQNNKMGDRKPSPSSDVVASSSVASPAHAQLVVGSSLPRAQRARLWLLKCGARRSRPQQFSTISKGGDSWVTEMDMGGINDMTPVLYSDAQGVTHPSLFPELRDVPSETDKSLKQPIAWQEVRREQKREQSVWAKRTPVPQIVVKSVQHIQQPRPRVACH